RRDFASEMHFDGRRTVERLLELRALHERARHAETELAVEAIVRTAREHARSRFDGIAAVDADHRAARSGGNRAHAPAAAEICAGRAGRLGERLIEHRAIDDGSLDALRVD